MKPERCPETFVQGIYVKGRGGRRGHHRYPVVRCGLPAGHPGDHMTVGDIKKYPHNVHALQRWWDFAKCATCQSILAEAKANHSSHAGNPDQYSPDAVEIRPGWWVTPHSDEECIRAYLHYAERMSAS